MRGLSCDAPTRALDGTFAMWKRMPCATRASCGGGPRVGRGTGTALLPSSRLWSSARKTEHWRRQFKQARDFAVSHARVGGESWAI